MTTSTDVDISSIAFAQYCPAYATHTTPSDLEEPFIFSVDGNIQHRRMKKRNTASQSSLSAPLFIINGTPAEEWDLLYGENPSIEGSCSHTFHAVDKPTTMQYYDETGLLGGVCRHGIPLRYINMKVGERYSWMLFLVRSITASAKVPIDGHEHYFTNYGLLYDIGCKFQAYVKRADPELYLHTKIRVNAFHIKAHELMCRILWGPRRAVGFGESDGKGCEHDWAEKAHLVASG